MLRDDPLAMARNPQPTPEKEWTPDSLRIAMRKLRRRLVDVQAFDPQTVPRRYDPGVIALETSIRETLTDVYGENSGSFGNYRPAADIDAASGPCLT